MLANYLPTKAKAISILTKTELTPLSKLGWKKLEKERPQLAKYLLQLVNDGSLEPAHVTGAALMLGLMLKTKAPKS